MDSGRSTASSSTTFSAEGGRFVRYFFVGGTAALVDIGLFMLFAQGFGFPYLRVATATFVIATLVNYVLSIRFVFKSGQRFGKRMEVFLVYLVSAVGLAVNAAILFVCVEMLALPLLLAKLAATGTVFFWNYLARRFFVFGGPGRHSREGGNPG